MATTRFSRRQPVRNAAILGIAVLGPATGAAIATTLHVDDDAAPGGDGLTWATAYAHLQDALAVASVPANGVDEIRVAEGMYRPDRDATVPSGSGDRTASFALVDGVTVRGGFAGRGAGAPDERDPVLHPTILSGDLAGDDAGGRGNAENSHHVVTATGVGTTTVLDGVTITGGHADGAGTDAGGAGLLSQAADPTVIGCRFAANVAEHGGAVHNAGGSGPALVGCLFEGNQATVTHGGAVYNEGGAGSILHCRFLGNTAADGGGAVFNFNGSTAEIGHSLFAGNTAGNAGGAVYNLLAARPRLVNVTLAGNTAGTDGGGMHSTSNSLPVLVNSIAWGNTDAGPADASAQVSTGTGLTTVDYCCIQGGWPTGVGNTDADPQFVLPAGPDGDPGTPADNDYRLVATSGCVDAGTNLVVASDAMDLDADADTTERTPVDLDGGPRFADVVARNDTGCGAPVIVDLGPYERPGIAADPMVMADVDGDATVDVTDLLRVLADWGDCGDACCPSDLVVDGAVDVNDIGLVLDHWH
jgi:hypothetical protein